MMRKLLLLSALMMALAHPAWAQRIVRDGPIKNVIRARIDTMYCKTGMTSADTASDKLPTGGWGRVTLQYSQTLISGGALSYTPIAQWSDDGVNWFQPTTQIVAAPIADANLHYDTLIVLPFSYFRLILRPEVGHAANGSKGRIWLTAKGVF